MLATRRYGMTLATEITKRLYPRHGSENQPGELGDNPTTGDLLGLAQDAVRLPWDGPIYSGFCSNKSETQTLRPLMSSNS